MNSAPAPYFHLDPPRRFNVVIPDKRSAEGGERDPESRKAGKGLDSRRSLPAAAGGSDESVRRTQEFWSRKYGQPISAREAKEIQENLFGFFTLLGKWRQERDRNELGFTRHNEVGSPG